MSLHGDTAGILSQRFKMAPPRVPLSSPSKKKDDSTSNDEEFFQYVPLSTYIVIVGLMTLYWFVCYRIHVVPLSALGPLGQLLSYLVDNHLKLLRLGFRFAVMAHCLEAGFAYRICRRMMFSRATSFKWMLQTVLLGFPSLGMLLRHRKEKELKNKKKS